MREKSITEHKHFTFCPYIVRQFSLFHLEIITASSHALPLDCKNYLQVQLWIAGHNGNRTTSDHQGYTWEYIFGWHPLPTGILLTFTEDNKASLDEGITAQAKSNLGWEEDKHSMFVSMSTVYHMSSRAHVCFHNIQAWFRDKRPSTWFEGTNKAFSVI